MLAHNKPQASTTSGLNPRPNGELRQGAGQPQQLTQSSLLPQYHPRQERTKRKISHRTPLAPTRTTTADSRLLHANDDRLVANSTTSLSHQPRRVDSQESMAPADSRTHLTRAFLQRPPSFEPFGIHRLDQQRQELLQRTEAPIETESESRIAGNTGAHAQDIEPRRSGSGTQDSQQYQLTNGRLPKADHRSKQYMAAVGGTTQHGDGPESRSMAPSTTIDLIFGRGPAEPHHDAYPSQSIHHSIGQPISIRDICDSEELRNKVNQLSDMYNSSVNSNPDPQPPQFTSSSAQAQGRTSHRSSPIYSQPLLSTAQTNRTGIGRGLRNDSVGNDLTMDTSLLESNFRERLEANIQVLEAPQEHQHTTDNGRATAGSNIRESDYRKLLPAERRRRELYSSSYSPSNFSSADEIEEEEEVDDNDDDEVEEEQHTAELKGSNIPRMAQTPSLPQPQSQSQLQLQQQPPNPIINSNQRRVESIERPNSEHVQEAGFDSDGEINFEREIVRARDKRIMGASQNNGAVVKASRQLDHGTDLAIEDLASPVRSEFEDNQGDRHPLRQDEHRAGTVEGPRGRTELKYPTMTAEDQFLELAGSLGEGQAVASVLERLKGMIRQLKSEKRSSMSAVKVLKKDLKQAQRELQRTRKANEKLSKAQSAPLTYRGESKYDKASNQDLENVTMRLRRGRPQEEQEQERRNNAIQREKERAELDLRELKQQIDALVKQKEAVLKTERLRAEAEADLLFLIESDSDDDEDGEDDSESESESESESDDEDGFRIQSESAASERNNQGAPLFDSRTRRNSKSKRRSPSKGAPGGKGKEIQRHRTEPHRSRDQIRLKGQVLGSRSKSAHPDTRSKVDKVEEVHIHHHVYYGEADMDDVLSARPRVLNGSQPRLHHSASRLDDRLSGQEDVHRLNARNSHRINDAGFDSYQRGSTHHGVLEQLATSKPPLSRSFPGQRMHGSQHFETHADELSPSQPPPLRRHQTQPHTVNWEGHGHRQQDLGSPVPAHKEREAYPLYRPGPQVISTTQGSTRMVTRVQHGFNLRSAGTHELTIPLKNPNSPRKKISIDLQRILSLLKTHDPRRCTVCCNGGDGRDHSTHNHNHQYQDDHQQQQQQHLQRPTLKIDGKPVLIRHKTSVATRSTVQQSSPPSRSKVNGGYPEAFSDSESSVSSESDGETRRKRTDRVDLRDHGAGVGSSSYPTRQRPQNQPLQNSEMGAIETSKGEGDDEDGHPPEWKLHVTLCKLDEEVQQLRKSHLDLSGKLEQLGSSSNMPKSAIGGDETGANPTTSARQDVSPEERDRKRQQRRQLRLQLQRVVDSLEEKAEEILSLQHYLLEQQQRQQVQKEKDEEEEGKVESREQRETADLMSESSGSSNRLKRVVREPLTVEGEYDDREEEAFESRRKENVERRQVSGGRGLKVPEGYKQRIVNGAHVS